MGAAKTDGRGVFLALPNFPVCKIEPTQCNLFALYVSIHRMGLLKVKIHFLQVML